YLEDDQLGLRVKLIGEIDRVDTLNDELRIVDYKTGNVEQSQLTLGEDNWEDFISDEKYSKAFQLLFYALLCEEELTEKSLVGIITFKKLNAGLMEFKDKNKPPNKYIDKAILARFKGKLITLINEILDPNQAFEEKEV
ncbi:MAG: PD-(D/E)XK nuclease family protein, partial [Psychroflexus sp.]|nr:PD-(D/E)XK nuclease family protein [Psychroflexus sp.]MDN6311034.1 PD-(D/E)XK nuclease family protein [Psychroflexus sp.]